MGTVYRRGRWLWIGFAGPGGPWVYKNSGYRPGQELLAKKLVREIEERIAAGDASAVSEITLEEYGASWAEARVRAGKWTNAKLDQAALTNHLYAAELVVGGRAVVLGGLPIALVDDRHVLVWLEHLEAKGLAGRTRASLLSLLNRMFKRALREQRVIRNPCAGLERGETPKQVDSKKFDRSAARFTLRELEQLVSDARVPLDRRVFYAIAFLGGMRAGEISALRWRNVDLRRRPLGCLKVAASFTRRNRREKAPKSGRPREVPVHPVTATLLQAWKAKGWARLFGRAPRPDDLVVPNRAGSYVTDNNLRDNFILDLKVLGLRHRRFHDTKRTFVSLAREGGAGPLLRWVSHGPTAREMLDTYSSPDWAALCREVRCVRARLRTRTVVQLAPTNFPTRGGYRVKGSTTTQEPQCPGRDSKSPGSGQVGDDRIKDSRGSLRATGTEGRRPGSTCSESTTARPFRGGMRIDEG